MSINIFICDCNLITHSVTVTNYTYIYFVIILRNFVTCNLLLSRTARHLGFVEQKLEVIPIWNNIFKKNQPKDFFNCTKVLFWFIMV